MSQIIIGYTTEGPTDIRFLESIIQRTFEEVAFECNTQIEVLPVINIGKSIGSFVDQGLDKCKKAYFNGVMAFCIHVDADDASDNGVYETRINPLVELIKSSTDIQLCSTIVPVVPVQMTEAWMLADKGLIKEEIGTDKSDIELGITGNPETIANPKNAIKEAIRIARTNIPKRRRKELKINELYLPIGQKIKIDLLDTLPSFIKFKESVRDAYRSLNYLQP